MLLKNNILFIILMIILTAFSTHKAYADFQDENDSSYYGNFVATRWAGNQQSAYSFSFDDGLKSQYDNAYSILSENGIIGTFYILPSFLTESLPGIWRYGTWPMFIEIGTNGNEIGSHTMTHPHLPNLEAGDPYTEGTIHYELFQSHLSINSRVTNTECITLAYPFAEHNRLVDSIAAIYYQSARADGIFPNSFSPQGTDWFGLNSYQVTFDFPRDVPEDDLDELNNFEEWISESIDSSAWAIQLVHEVVPFSELSDLLTAGSFNPISNEWFSMLCEWLYQKRQEGKLWIETVGNITKYIRERDCYQSELISVSGNQIKIQILDTLDNSIYNYPLSGLVKIPGDWDSVWFQQSSRIENLKKYIISLDTIVVANIIPDGGVASLSNYIPDYAGNEINPAPSDFVLYQNYPNPFNPTTVIKYSIPVETQKFASVQLKVFDILGREVTTLVNEEKSAGNYELEFNASELTSGIYFYKLKAGSFIHTKKMILLK